MEFDFWKELWGLAKVAGPFGAALATTVAAILYRKLDKVEKDRDRLYMELLQQERQNSANNVVQMERVLKALNNASVSITTSASSSESLRGALQLIIQATTSKGHH